MKESEDLWKEFYASEQDINSYIKAIKKIMEIEDEYYNNINKALRFYRNCTIIALAVIVGLLIFY